jgi:hypothetical protein
MIFTRQPSNVPDAALLLEAPSGAAGSGSAPWLGIPPACNRCTKSEQFSQMANSRIHDNPDGGWREYGPL